MALPGDRLAATAGVVCRLDERMEGRMQAAHNGPDAILTSPMWGGDRYAGSDTLMVSGRYPHSDEAVRTGDRDLGGPQ